MSQDAVSLASGVDRSYLSEIENGKVSPTIDVIDRIAQALDVAPKHHKGSGQNTIRGQVSTFI